MPKRKRSDYERPSLESDIPIDIEGEEGGEESTRSIAIHQKTIEQKIHHSRTLLRRALKTAKGFEQQKLGKRIKSARKGEIPTKPNSKPKPTKDGGKTETNEVDRLEKEIDALKQVDLDALAARHLNKVLSKNRTLYNSIYFPPGIVREVEEASKVVMPTGAMANVCARMLNANPVKESMKEIIGNLARLLGVDEAIEDGGKPRKEKEEVDKSEKKPKEPKAIIHGTDNKSKSNDSLIGGDDEDDSEEDSEDAVVHPSTLKSLATKYLRSGGDISSDESDDDLDGRIASSSEGEDEDDEEEEEEEEDISDSEDDRPRGRSMSITPIPEDQLREIEALEDEEFDIDLSDEEAEEKEEKEAPPRKKSEKQKSKKQTAPLAPPPTEPIKSSSFLPTLMAGYISGSDSDAASDTSSAQNKSRKKKKGPPEKKARKNRMGQQARRALAEKKYGTGANHVKKAKEEKEAKVKAKEERQRAWEEKQTKAVHISWELKKKEKDEKDKIVKDLMAGKGGAVGKKIVFD